MYFETCHVAQNKGRFIGGSSKARPNLRRDPVGGVYAKSYRRTKNNERSVVQQMSVLIQYPVYGMCGGNGSGGAGKDVV